MADNVYVNYGDPSCIGFADMVCKNRCLKQTDKRDASTHATTMFIDVQLQ